MHQFSATPKPSAVDRRNAERAAQALIDRVARRHAEGDLFAPERLRLLRLTSIAMGAARAGAGQLLSEALDGDPAAERQVQLLVAELILMA